ncbi:hypothetical protein MHK_000582 [Candidatus Magnetomorum sp. HK-1]|nr:hypothetical protein MHK_000582 [Candidatus Magnetomorum sp. HK-1]
MLSLKKIITYFIGIIIIGNLFYVYADEKSPYLKAPNPYTYKKPSELWGIKVLGKEIKKKPDDNSKKSVYEEMATDWFVFSDRDNLKLYESLNKQKVVKVFNFLDKFKVLKAENKHLYIESTDNDVKGWAPMESLLIISHAYKTENSVIHKAVLINKIGSIKGDINAVNPLRSPFKNAKPTGESIRILEFANIYNYFPNEKNPEYILLGKNPFYLPYTNTSKDMKEMMLGWVPATRVLTWDTREALQPNTKRKHPIYYFKNEKDLKSYYEKHIDNNTFPTCDNVPSCKNSQPTDKELLVIRPDYESKIDRSKWPKKLFRYAILRNNNDIKKPFEIGVSSATLDERIFKKNLTETIENQRAHMGNRDIVFLIDATMSMGPYFKLVGDIAKNFMNQFAREKKKNKDIGDLRFGVALYRDYLNKDKCFELHKKGYLSVNDMQIKKYLDGIKPLRSFEDKADPAYYPEAVFQGIINTIEQMNWKKGSRKLIIHIGDVGNNSRKMDNFTEKLISKQLAENDISYCAIQLVKPSLDNEHFKAQSLMCQQTRLIINHTAKNMLDIVHKNVDINIFPKDNINRLQSIIDISKNADCSQVDNVCTPVGKRRWLLRCIKSDDQAAYKKAISDQINQLASEIYEAKSILDDIRQGNKVKEADIKESDINESVEMDQAAYESDENVSSKPFLMPGLVNSLIIDIGKDLLSKKDDPAINAKILNYIGPARMKLINDPVAQKEIIQIIGKKELQLYINDDVNFFTKAYVYFKRPGKKYTNDPDQLIKMVLFQKSVLEDLRQPLSTFNKKWQCQIHPENLKQIWRGFMLAILGENQNSSYDLDKSISIKTLYEKQYGISLRNSHPLLKLKYGDIEKGNYPADIGNLANYLCEAQKRLKRIYFDEDSYFKIFGENFIWIEASQLP